MLEVDVINPLIYDNLANIIAFLELDHEFFVGTVLAVQDKAKISKFKTRDCGKNSFGS